MQCFRDAQSQFRDGNGFVAPNIAGDTVLSAFQEPEEPHDQIVGVKVTAERGPVAPDHDRIPGKRIAQKVAEGEVDVPVQISSGKGEKA